MVMHSRAIRILDPDRNPDPDCNPDHQHNLVDWSLARDTPQVKDPCKSVQDFISKPLQSNTIKNIDCSRFMSILVIIV